jgi:uncharacterized glyoxalase superfamily protein PhnB
MQSEAHCDCVRCGGVARNAIGGTDVQDLASAGWATRHGMIDDRFGIVRVLDVVAEYVPA